MSVAGQRFWLPAKPVILSEAKDLCNWLRVRRPFASLRTAIEGPLILGSEHDWRTPSLTTFYTATPVSIWHPR